MDSKETEKAKDNTRAFKLYIILFAIALIFTGCVALIDRRAVGPNGSWVGFATINQKFNEFFGYTRWLHVITEYAGYIPALGALVYALIGISQLIKRKSIKKVDTGLLVLAGFYALVGLVYFGFELLCLNCRPVLIDGELEASYPSSHTFLTVALCCSSLLINKMYFSKTSWARWMNIASIVFLIFVPLGRLFCGVHWLTDIIGGYLIGAALVALLNFALLSIPDKTTKKAKK